MNPTYAARTRSKNNPTPQTILESKQWSHFGTHLTLDGYLGDSVRLNSMEKVFSVLDTLPEKLGMHKIITPYVIKCGGNDKKDPGGISGFVMIAESHISIHTFPDRKFVSIDVYTCQDHLATEKIVGILKDEFGLRETETNVIKRGKRFGELARLS